MIECPSCERSEESVPVWESVDSFQRGSSPDYIGCTSCREMVEI